MVWKKFMFCNKKGIKNMNVFLLKVELSFKTVAQVSYKDEYGNTKIVRFLDKYWSREVTSLSGNPEDICFSFFAHSPNLIKDEDVQLSISLNGELLLSKGFIVDKDKEFAGWWGLVEGGSDKTNFIAISRP
jgi:hypothetical protein